MFEPHQKKYLERVWTSQKDTGEAPSGFWYWTVLALCGALMLVQPFPEFLVPQTAKLVSMIYVVVNTLALSLMWWFASAEAVSKWDLDKVFHRSLVAMAVESGWRDGIRYAIMLLLAAGFVVTNSLWAGAVVMIWLVMKVELKHRWRMILVHRLSEIPKR